jgi:hypothetical protein
LIKFGFIPYLFYLFSSTTMFTRTHLNMKEELGDTYDFFNYCFLTVATSLTVYFIGLEAYQVKNLGLSDYFSRYNVIDSCSYLLNLWLL